ncbi:MAG: FkbM family methyltransferase [Pseudomonadota bacterium]
MNEETPSPHEQKMIDHLHHIERRLASLQTTMSYIALGPERVLNFVHQDKPIAMYLPDAMTDNIQKFIMEKRHFWEERLLSKALPALTGCRSALDIGANVGNHTLFFACVAGIEKVTAFEPQRHVFGILEKNIELNGLPGVTAINSAVGEKTGSADIAIHRNTSFHGTAYREADDGSVPVISVDEFATDPVDFIKIDVEGMQMSVLRGAEQVLRRDRPKLWIELRRNHNEFGPANEFLESLGVGYRASPLSGDDMLFVAR